MTYKPKKNHVIAIERAHSCHSIGMKRTEWRDIVLGRARLVNRKGIVEQFTIGNSDLAYSVDRNCRVFILSETDKREAAERLLAVRGHEPFASADELKTEILRAVNHANMTAAEIAITKAALAELERAS